MSIFAKLDCDLLDDPAFVPLILENEAYALWWLRLVVLAKRINCRGQVLCGDGKPARARDLAIAQHRDRRREADWQVFLDLCCELGLLVEEDGVFRIVDWRRWHGKPSDDADEIRQRVNRHRERQRAGDVTPCNASNACNATEQSREEQSRAEQPPPRDPPTPTPEHTPPLVVAAEGILLGLTPGGLSRDVRRKLNDFLEVPNYTGPVKLAALEQGVAEARAAVESQGVAKIRAPDHLALKQASLALGQLNQTRVKEPNFF